MVDFTLKPEDGGVPEAADDDVAIAIGLDALGEIEADVLSMNGFIAEARQAVRAAKGLTDSPTMRRLLNRALRANDDAITRGLSIVERARSL